LGTSDHLSPLSHSHFKTLHLFRFSFSASQPFYLHLSLHFTNFSSLCFLLFFLSFSLPFLSFFPSPFLLFLTSVSNLLFCLSFFFPISICLFLIFLPFVSHLLFSDSISISLSPPSFSNSIYISMSYFIFFFALSQALSYFCISISFPIVSSFSISLFLSSSFFPSSY